MDKTKRGLTKYLILVGVRANSVNMRRRRKREDKKEKKKKKIKVWNKTMEYEYGLYV